MPDRTCSYCGKRLTFFLKLSGDGRFCSSHHRKLYQEEMEKLALESLSRSELVTRQRMAEPNPPTRPREPEPAAATLDAPVPPLGDILACHPASRPPAALRRRTFGIVIRIGTLVPESAAREEAPQRLALCRMAPLVVTIRNDPAAARSADCAGPLRSSVMVYPARGRAGASESLGMAAEVKLAIRPVQPGKAALTPGSRRSRRTGGPFLTTRFVSSSKGPTQGGMSGMAGPVRLPVTAAWFRGAIAIDPARFQGRDAPAMAWPGAMDRLAGGSLSQACKIPLPPLRPASPVPSDRTPTANAPFPLHGAIPASCTSVRSLSPLEPACVPVPMRPGSGRILVVTGPVPADRPYTPPSAIPHFHAVRSVGLEGHPDEPVRADPEQLRAVVVAVFDAKTEPRGRAADASAVYVQARVSGKASQFLTCLLFKLTRGHATTALA